MLVCLLVPDAGIVAGRRRVGRRGRRFGNVAWTGPRQGYGGVGKREHAGTMPRQGNRAGDWVRRRQGVGRGIIRRIRCSRLWRRDEGWVRENTGRRRCLHRNRGGGRRGRRGGGGGRGNSGGGG